MNQVVLKDIVQCKGLEPMNGLARYSVRESFFRTCQRPKQIKPGFLLCRFPTRISKLIWYWSFLLKKMAEMCALPFDNIVLIKKHQHFWQKTDDSCSFSDGNLLWWKDPCFFSVQFGLHYSKCVWLAEVVGTQRNTWVVETTISDKLRHLTLVFVLRRDLTSRRTNLRTTFRDVQLAPPIRSAEKLLLTRSECSNRWCPSAHTLSLSCHKSVTSGVRCCQQRTSQVLCQQARRKESFGFFIPFLSLMRRAVNESGLSESWCCHHCCCHCRHRGGTPPGPP